MAGAKGMKDAERKGAPMESKMTREEALRLGVIAPEPEADPETVAAMHRQAADLKQRLAELQPPPPDESKRPPDEPGFVWTWMEHGRYWLKCPLPTARAESEAV